MSYTLQIFQINQQLTQQQNKQQLIKQLTDEMNLLLGISPLIKKCEYPECQKEFTLKNKYSKTRFCSTQCVGKSQRKDRICIGCGKIFQNYNTRTLNRSSKPKFCTRQCYKNHMPLVNKPGNYRYNKFYFCDHCEKWIPHKDAIIYDNWPCCPNKSCGDTRFINSPNKLSISAQKSLFNQLRKNVKYIE